MSTTTETLASAWRSQSCAERLTGFLHSDGRPLGRKRKKLLLRNATIGLSNAKWRRYGTRIWKPPSLNCLALAHTVACSSGTAAVHLAVAALDPEPGDEFIVPPVTDMGTYPSGALAELYPRIRRC